MLIFKFYTLNQYTYSVTRIGNRIKVWNISNTIYMDPTEFFDYWLQNGQKWIDEPQEIKVAENLPPIRVFWNGSFPYSLNDRIKSISTTFKWYPNFEITSQEELWKKEGKCLKCGHAGIWRAMACICPTHGKILG